VRPAILSNPSWEAIRMNHPIRIKPCSNLFERMHEHLLVQQAAIACERTNRVIHSA
jgi:hypothetical protein